MTDKSLPALLLLIGIVTAIMFVTVYTPPSDSTIIKTFTRLTSIMSTSTTTYRSTATHTVRIIVNSTKTIQVTIDIQTDCILYHDANFTFTVYPDSVVYDSTTTVLPDVDASIIFIGELSRMCQISPYITGTDTFWPELFLQQYGYTTAVLTAVDACKNAYIVTAG